MRKTLAALALAASGIALASPALADDPPPVPVTPGAYTLHWWNGKQTPATVALDCGPACFSWTDEVSRDEFHWAADKWLEPGGVWTVDGITYTNRNGKTATLG